MLNGPSCNVEQTLWTLALLLELLEPQLPPFQDWVKGRRTLQPQECDSISFLPHLIHLGGGGLLKIPVSAACKNPLPLACTRPTHFCSSNITPLAKASGPHSYTRSALWLCLSPSLERQSSKPSETMLLFTHVQRTELSLPVVGAQSIFVYKKAN